LEEQVQIFVLAFVAVVVVMAGRVVEMEVVAIVAVERVEEMEVVAMVAVELLLGEESTIYLVAKDVQRDLVEILLEVVETFQAVEVAFHMVAFHVEDSHKIGYRACMD
jgi:hypothetical protein